MTRPYELAALEEIAKRFSKATDLRKGCFQKQLDLVQDPNRFRAAQCGRRGGKTVAIAKFLLIGAVLSPGTVSLYLSLTRKNAKRIIWPIMDTLNRKYDLKMIPKLGDLIWELPNGSEIHVSGCPDMVAVQTFRGTPYRRVAIDEAGMYTPCVLESLVDDALLPSLVDYQGDMLLAGSPGVAPVGYLYEVMEGEVDGWAKHHWTMLDNPHIPNAAQEIEMLCRRKGWTLEHPTIQREYFGRNVADKGMLVFGRFSADMVVDFDDMPKLPWRYTLGIDFGTSTEKETMAYSIVAHCDQSPIVWVVETIGEMGGTPATCALTIDALRKRYDFDRIVGDPGSLGKEFIAQLRMRYSVPIYAAEKQHKLAYVELLNGDMKGGLVRFVQDRTTSLTGEMKHLPWSDDTRTKEKKGVPNHHCDATLYAYRWSRHYDQADEIKEKTREELIMQEMSSKSRRRHGVRR